MLCGGGGRGRMASVLHFKFRNALQSDMVSFDGDHVSLQDLKRLSTPSVSVRLLVAADKALHPGAMFRCTDPRPLSVWCSAVSKLPQQLPPGRIDASDSVG